MIHAVTFTIAFLLSLGLYAIVVVAFLEEGHYRPLPHRWATPLAIAAPLVMLVGVLGSAFFTFLAGVVYALALGIHVFRDGMPTSALDKNRDKRL
jgi:hypothetical protein